jgi:hypothetical protein
MAFSAVTARGTNSERTADTAITISPGANIAAGQGVFVTCVTDNESTTTGATSTHTIADTDVNSWTKVYEYTYSPGGVADDGTTVSAWVTVLAAQMATSDVVTLTISGTVTSKTIHIAEFTKGAGTTLSVEASDQEAPMSTGAVLAGMASREYLLIAVGARENEDVALTNDADYTVVADSISSTTGAADTNVALGTQIRIATLTGDTYLPSSAGTGDVQVAVGAVYEVSGGAGSASPGVISRSFTVDAPTVKGAAVAAPSAISRSFVTPAPTVKGSAIALPGVIARSFTLPAPTVKGAAVAVVSAIARAFALGQVTAGAGGTTVTPDTIARAFGVHAPTVKGSAVAAPAAIARSFTLPAPTVKGAAVHAAAVIARSFIINAATIQGAAKVLPGVIARSFLLGQVVAGGGAAGTVSPAAIARAFTMPGVTVSGKANVAAGTIAIVITLPAASAFVPAEYTWQEGGLTVTIQGGGIIGGQMSGGLSGGTQG